MKKAFIKKKVVELATVWEKKITALENESMQSNHSGSKKKLFGKNKQ